MNTQYVELLLEGFLNNVLFTVCAAIIPFLVGVACCAITRRNRIIDRIFSWLSLPMECVCPIALLIVMFFFVLPFSRTAFFPVVITLTIAFLGYMPARHVTDWSVWKNMLYHGIGLFSAIFKWTFVVGYIGGTDLLRAATIIRNGTYDVSVLLIPLAVSFGVLFVLEVARRLIKTFMK